MHSIIYLSNITGPSTAGNNPVNSVYLLIFLLKTNDDMVCKVVKFFIDACFVEGQFVSPNTQISVCKILQSFIFAGFRWQVHEFKGALKLSSSITGNLHSLIKTSFNQNCKKWNGLHWHLAWTCTSQTCFTDLFVLINTPWNRTSVNINVELWSIQGGAENMFFSSYIQRKKLSTVKAFFSKKIV